jgi:hypothetical protein
MNISMSGRRADRKKLPIEKTGLWLDEETNNNNTFTD